MHATLCDRHEPILDDDRDLDRNERNAAERSDPAQPGAHIAINFGDPVSDRRYTSVTMSVTRLTVEQLQIISAMAVDYPRHCVIVTCYRNRRGGGWSPVSLRDDIVAAVGRAPELWYWGYDHLGITFGGARRHHDPSFACRSPRGEHAVEDRIDLGQRHADDHQDHPQQLPFGLAAGLAGEC
jgi:hypothetical protein